MSGATGSRRRITRRRILQAVGLAGAGVLPLPLLGCDGVGRGEGGTPSPASSSPPADNGTAERTGSSPASQPSPEPARSTPTPGDFVAREIPARPTDSSITMNVAPSRPLTLFYEYGTAPGAYSARSAPQVAEPGAPLDTLISGLEPNRRYYYRLRYGDTAGEEASFVTQRARGSTFTFCAQGDSHPERDRSEFNATLYERTLRLAAGDRPDFYFVMGDDFSVDTLKTVTPETVAARYALQRPYLRLVGAPVFLVNGNHEQAALANFDGTAENVAVWAQNSRNRWFPQPGPDRFYTGNEVPVEHVGLLQNYFAFTWGDALFVAIDPYWHSTVPVDNVFGGGQKTRDLWNITLGETQYRWFKRTLETSTATHKFVFAHHVNGTGRGGIELANTFEWGNAAEFPARRPGWSAPIHQLMAANRVAIFFQGHDHIFVRQELDGVVYQTLPEPADPNYSLFNADAYRTGDKLPNSGYARVTVSPTGVKVEYVRSYLPGDEGDGKRHGEVAFSYTIAR